MKSLRPSNLRKVADDLPPSLASGPRLCLPRYAPTVEDEIRCVLQNNAAAYRLVTVGGWCTDDRAQGWRRRALRLLAEGAAGWSRYSRNCRLSPSGRCIAMPCLDPDRLSFVHALEVVRIAIPEFQMTAPAQHGSLCKRLLRDLVWTLLLMRRLRLNPRVVKR